MAKEWIGDLVAQLHTRKIGRREFARRAAALGLSAGLIGQALRVADARAQDASPAASPGASPMASPGASPAAGGTIGRADVPHITDTSKGLIRFYSSWPLIATYEEIGGDSRESVMMALEDFGMAAGGFALEYEALDDAIASTGNWDPGKEAENANRAVNDPDAMVYFGTYNSGAAAISIPILNVVPMAMISAANTAAGLTQSVEGITEPDEPDKYYPTGKRNYMRPTVADHLQGGAQANWAIENGYDTAYVLHDNELYGKGVATAFRFYYEQLGGEVLGFEGYQRDAADYQALATSIADAAPKLIEIGAIVANNPGKLIQDLRSVMSADDVQIITPDGTFNQAFIDSTADAGEGVYLTFGGVPPTYLETEVGKTWAARIGERLGGRSPDAYAIYAYESAIIAMQAIDEVQVKDRVRILDAMFATKNFNGLSGTYSFTETGDPDRPSIFLGQLRDGVIERVDFITPPTS